MSSLFQPSSAPAKRTPVDRLGTMDNGWAIVIGATIALVGAIGAPWAQAEIAGRAQRRRESQLARGAGIARVLRALVELDHCVRLESSCPDLRREAEEAVLEFDLTLIRGQQPASDLVVTGYRLIGRRLTDDPEGVLNVLAGTLLRWHRGDTGIDSLTEARQDLLSGRVDLPMRSGTVLPDLP